MRIKEITASILAAARISSIRTGPLILFAFGRTPRTENLLLVAGRDLSRRIHVLLYFPRIVFNRGNFVSEEISIFPLHTEDHAGLRLKNDARHVVVAPLQLR